jgi:hypothetical protein
MCLSRIFKSLVVMDYFYKSYVETDLATLHYVNFIEPFNVLPTEPLSFDSAHFTSNYTNKVFESNINDPFLRFEEHFFAAVMLYRKNTKVQFEDMPHEVLEFFFHKYKISGTLYFHNKVYQNMLLLIILILQMCIVKFTQNENYQSRNRMCNLRCI